ncbi:Mariner Mos1 transposase [Eumeta japonica]|uniref:Mariner Mos1 transposase n=1 Tax=Eumeta variegata TaxID=151549 RepID=A0A4C1U1K1_EUMVA|nr:Mariner Mos1 transposase [Eumeta japonica]
MQDHHVTYCKIEASLGIKVFEEMRKNTRQRRIILHHDNASCDTSAETTRLLEGQKIGLTGHPSCSPDLAHKDFYLFPSMKNNLCEQMLRDDSGEYYRTSSRRMKLHVPPGRGAGQRLGYFRAFTSDSGYLYA